MARWEASDIIPYFCDKFVTGEESCLPYLPEEWKCSIQGRNEEIDILHAKDEKNSRIAGTINLLKRPGLKTWRIECFFAHPDKPEFAKVTETAGWTPSYWVGFFEGAMYERKVLEMTITGLDYVCYVTVENFEYSKRSGEELDTYYTLDLKEYVFTEIKKEDISISINVDTTIPPTNTGSTTVKTEKPVIETSMWCNYFLWQTWDKSKGMGNLVVDSSAIRTASNQSTANAMLPLQVKYLPIKTLQEAGCDYDNLELSDIGKTVYEQTYNGLSTTARTTSIASSTVKTSLLNAVTSAGGGTLDVTNVGECFDKYCEKLYGSSSCLFPITQSTDGALYIFMLTLIKYGMWLYLADGIVFTKLKSTTKTTIRSCRNAYSSSLGFNKDYVELTGKQKVFQVEALSDPSDLSVSIKGNKYWIYETQVQLQNNDNKPCTAFFNTMESYYEILKSNIL